MRNDLLLVLRGFARAPLTALLAMAALAAGIAVTLSIFAVARGVLLRPLPYPDDDRLVLIWQGTTRDPGARGPLSPPDALDVREQVSALSAVGAVNSFSTTWVPEEGDPEQLQLGVVAGDFFGAMGVAPRLGRTLRPSDDRPLDTRDPATVSTVVLSHGFWTRALGADPGVIGRTLEFGGSRMAVVGVMPASFRLHMPVGAGMSTELIGWTPLAIDYAAAPRDGAYLKVIGRLAPDATLARAQAELDALATRLRSTVATHQTAGLLLRAAPLKAEVSAHIRPILLLLSAAGVLLLIVAGANAASLLLVRFMARRPEVALRCALGAGKGAVVRPLLLESGAVTLGGALLGLLLAGPAVRLLLALEPGIVPRAAPIGIDGAAVLVALGMALLLALACGLGPALLATRGELSLMLRGRRAGGTRGAQRLRGAVIVLQAAASFALLYGSASLMGTLARLEAADLGFQPTGVMTARVTLPFTRYRGPDPWIRFFEELSERLGAQPGVAAAGLTSDLPMTGELTPEPYVPVELESTTEWGASNALHRVVGPGWFEAVGVPVRAGRDFSAVDREGAPQALIVDEALARTLAETGPGPIVGRRLVVTAHEFRAGYRITRRTGEIVGVVATVPHEHPDAAPPGTIYMPHAQYPLWSMVLTVAGVGRTPDVAVLRGALDDLDPQLPLSSVRPLQAVVRETLAPTRFVLALIGILSLAVITLTAAGLFGVVAEVVRQRRREMGVRLALGSTPAALSLRVLRAGLALTILGLLPGALLAPTAGRLLEGSLAGTGGLRPAALLAAAGALLAVAAAASLVPAWRAGRVDPIEALREE